MSPNRNYLAGRRLEWDIANQMREKGYKVIRASASRGEFDLVCYKPGSTIFIQAKRVSKKSEMERMLKTWVKNPPEKPGEVNFVQQLWVRVKGVSVCGIASA